MTVIQTQQQTQPHQEYQIRPPYSELFKPRDVQAIMKQVLTDFLHDKQYDGEQTLQWSQQLSTLIKNKLKQLKQERYKYLCQVIICEQKNAGIRIGAKCLWDQTTDKMAQETYQNSTLFCVAIAFGVYLY